MQSVLILFSLLMQLFHPMKTEIDKCNEQETFNLVDMGRAFEFSGESKCDRYRKLYRFNPDPNATKGRVLAFPKLFGSWYMEFDVNEFTAYPNGTMDRNISRARDSKYPKIRFAPTTGILVMFKIYGGSYDPNSPAGFTATITETPLNHHCPYPFIDLQPTVPIVIEEMAIRYECQMLVTAPKDYVVRIDHIKGTADYRDTVIEIYETPDDVIERFKSFPVDETLTVSNRIIIDVEQDIEQNDVYEIQVSAVKRGNYCGPTTYVFNESLTPALFRTPGYPNKHWKMVPCEMNFELPVQLREKYKMEVGYFNLEWGYIDIKDGPNGIRTLNKLMYRPLIVESPKVTLKYVPSYSKGDVHNVEISLVERQKGCDCPHLPNISSNFYIEIPAYCRMVDCSYLLPKFDDGIAEYYVERDLVQDYIVVRSEAGEEYIFTDHSNDTGTWEEQRRQIIRFKREGPTRRPTIFNLTYTTSGVHLSHDKRCGCVNQTVHVRANETLNFTSPKWPAHYCNNLVCVVTYIAPVDHHLEVNLDTTISLEPHNDRLEFFNGAILTTGQIKNVTGELVLSDSICSSGPVITTVFISNGAVSFDGFNGSITAVADESNSNHLSFHISVWFGILIVFIIIAIASASVRHFCNRRGLYTSRNIPLANMERR